MPLILVGIPVSNVLPSDLAVAPSWARAMSDCFVSRAGPGPRPARMHPVTSSWRDGRKETQAPHVDIVHLVPWKPAARRHRRFGELHRRPGQGAEPARHRGAG